MSQNTKAKGSSVQAFILFPQLPPETQLAIWDFAAFVEPRIIDVVLAPPTNLLMTMDEHSFPRFLLYVTNLEQLNFDTTRYLSSIQGLSGLEGAFITIQLLTLCFSAHYPGAVGMLFTYLQAWETQRL